MDPNNQNTNYPGLNAPQFQVGIPQPQSYQVLYPAPQSQPQFVQPQTQFVQPQTQFVQPQTQFVQSQPQFVQSQPQFVQPIPVQQTTVSTYPPMQNVPVSAQPQLVYFQPTPPPSAFIDNRPLLQYADLKTQLTSQHYHVEIGHWISEGWHLYKQHWLSYSLFTLIYILVAFIPYVGSIFALLLFPGLLIAGLHQVRPSTSFTSMYLLHGAYYFLPIFGISLLYALAVMFGLLLLIVPGIWFAVVLAFAPLIYLEHHDAYNDIGVLTSLSISRKVASKQFCSLFLFFLAVLFLNIFGAFTIIGILITFPVTNLAMVVGFQHMFGLNQQRRIDNNCVCSC